MTARRLLVVTPDPGDFRSLPGFGEPGQARYAGGVAEARSVLRADGSLALVLVDRDTSAARELAADGTPVVLVLRAPSLEATAESLAAGVRDVAAYPPDAARLAVHLSGAGGDGSPSVRVAEGGAEGNLIGTGPAILQAFRTLARVGPTRAPVVLEGEPGTGKRTAALFLHRGATADAPFVELSCASLPEALQESELFGHEAGTFPWAIARRRGRMERASGGTLFLDEVDQLPLRLQVRLLEALREGVVERVGSAEATPVSVRVVAASGGPLRARVAEGAFLADLHALLGSVTVTLPPLRERREDAALLASHFAARAARAHGRRVTALGPDLVRKVETHDWPGNVRELQSAMEHAVLVADAPELRAEHLPDAVRWPGAAGRAAADDTAEPPRATLDEVEAAHIRRVFRAAGDNLSRASDVLGIHRNTLRRKLRKYGIA